MDDFYYNLADLAGGFYASYKLTNQTGYINTNIPINAIDPKKQVFGAGYELDLDDNINFSLDFLLTKVDAKKAKDTYNIYWQDEGAKNSFIKYRSNAYETLDLLASIQYKFITLKAGIFNLKNARYITWQSARSIRPFGTSNLIDQNTSKGIARFYAPERNYRAQVKLEF